MTQDNRHEAIDKALQRLGELRANLSDRHGTVREMLTALDQAGLLASTGSLSALEAAKWPSPGELGNAVTAVRGVQEKIEVVQAELRAVDYDVLDRLH